MPDRSTPASAVEQARSTMSLPARPRRGRRQVLGAPLRRRLFLTVTLVPAAVLGMLAASCAAPGQAVSWPTMHSITDRPGSNAPATDRPGSNAPATDGHNVGSTGGNTGGSGVSGAASGQAVSRPTLHFITNRHGSNAPAVDGYDVFDTGVSGLSGLPAGVKGLVWLGQKCPTRADAAFRTTIDKLASNPKVFGYYLSDEPHVSDCPGGAAALATRADYIRSRTGGAQKSFIVLFLVADYASFKPANSHVDLVGIDPYPCSKPSPTCPVSKITDTVDAAISAGIPRSAIVPVFQAFGQENVQDDFYRLPTAAQMRAMLAEWDRLVPSPVMDYAYGWGHQSSANPTLVDSPSLQQVLAAHNGVTLR